MDENIRWTVRSFSEPVPAGCIASACSSTVSIGLHRNTRRRRTARNEVMQLPCSSAPLVLFAGLLEEIGVPGILFEQPARETGRVLRRCKTGLMEVARVGINIVKM